MKMKKQEPVSRRTILKGAAAATAASTFTIVNSKSIRGSEANSMVEIGFVGCGGQGARGAKKLEATGQGKKRARGAQFHDPLHQNGGGVKSDPQSPPPGRGPD